MTEYALNERRKNFMEDSLLEATCKDLQQAKVVHIRSREVPFNHEEWCKYVYAGNFYCTD
ncbi:MAG: hypothetical protein QW331_00110 [Candidatus Woesearchaeota archaeon]